MKNEKKFTHGQTFRNINNFIKNERISLKTKRNVNDFFIELCKIDPLKLTEFELSFKVRNKILNKNELRILNLDSKAYSYRDQKAYLLRLLEYKKIIWNKTKNPIKGKVFSALGSVYFQPMDLYVGADVRNDRHLFAFWLILGGVKPSGKINFIKNPKKVLSSIFRALEIKPLYKINPKSILNFGFDISDKESFYKIYYILDKKNTAHISQKEKDTINKISDFLGRGYRYWFFVSERYKIGATQIIPQRKKIYLEFLDAMKTNDEKTYDVIGGIFNIVGCLFSKSKIKNMLNILEGKVVILAFEEDGTVTFYIRV